MSFLEETLFYIVEKICERGDLNPQAILLALPPQGSVSASSTTSAKVKK